MKFKSAKYCGWFQPQTPQGYRGPRPVRQKASIIIPFGSVDYLKPLTECIRSVRWQEYVNHNNVEVLLVYLHKEDESGKAEEMRKLEELVVYHQLGFIAIEKKYDHFPLCLARNIGARAAENDVLVFIDADSILDPEFLARSLIPFTQDKPIFATCWFSYLRKGHRPVTKKSQVRRRVPDGQVRRYAYGGGIIAPRSVIHEIRGFDEVYDRAWGADDNDMVDRLIEYGLEWYNLSAKENIVNIHQWHPVHNREKEPGTIANRRRYYSLHTVVRNEDGWGETAFESADFGGWP